MADFKLNTNQMSLQNVSFTDSEPSHFEISSLQFFKSFSDVIFCSILFYVAALIADSYMVPLLESLACKLRMPHSLAGVTLLAVANGAPDIFVSRAVFLKGPNEASLGIGALFGAALVDFLVVFGIVILSCAEEFRNASRPFLRDILFYMTAATAVVYVCNYAREISTSIAISLLALYVIYIATVVIARVIRVRYLTGAGQNQLPTHEIDFSEDPFEHLDTNDGTPSSPGSDLEVEIDDNESSEDQDLPLIDLTMTYNAIYDDDIGRGDVEIVIVATEPAFNFREELRHARRAIFLFSWSDYNHHRTRTSKWLYVIRSTVCTVMNFFVHTPEICGDLQEDSWDDIRFFWCRLSTCIQMFISAHFMVSLGLGFKLFHPVQIYTIHVILIIPVSLAVILVCVMVFYCSKTYQTPKFYFIIVLFNFVVCFCMLSLVVDVIADRVLNFCAMFHVKPIIMGFTVVAWGNSIGDLVANRAMARRGMPRVGVTACFSGQLMNLLLALTLAAFTRMLTSGNPIRFEPCLDILFLFSLITFVCVILILSALFYKFKFPKYFAVLLIIMYAVISPFIVMFSKVNLTVLMS